MICSDCQYQQTFPVRLCWKTKTPLTGKVAPKNCPRIILPSVRGGKTNYLKQLVWANNFWWRRKDNMAEIFTTGNRDINMEENMAKVMSRDASERTIGLALREYSEVDLRDTNLTHIDMIQHSELWHKVARWPVGIKVYKTVRYPVFINGNRVTIGCQNKYWGDWQRLTRQEIENEHGCDSYMWWRRNRVEIGRLVESAVAELQKANEPTKPGTRNKVTCKEGVIFEQGPDRDHRWNVYINGEHVTNYTKARARQLFDLEPIKDRKCPLCSEPVLFIDSQQGHGVHMARCSAASLNARDGQCGFRLGYYSSKEQAENGFDRLFPQEVNDEQQ